MTKLIHPYKSDDEFNRFLLELTQLVCRHGISKHAPDIENTLSLVLFENAVHEGWKQAQDQACGELLSIVDELDEIAKKIKSRNRNRQKDASHVLKISQKSLKIRIRKIQYIFNTIAWTLFGQKDYVIRRFYRQSQNNITRKTISEIYPIADNINKSPNAIAILSDLTTFVHIGDLIIKNNHEDKRTISIAEVKTGRKNHELLEIIKFFEESGCERFLGESMQRLNESERTQLLRMVSQQDAAHQALSTLRTDRGTDLQTGLEVRLLGQENFVPPTYTSEINSAYSTLNDQKHWAIGEIDNCIFFGIYKEKFLKYGHIAFQEWMKGIDTYGPTINYASCFFVDTARPIFTIDIDQNLIDEILTDKIVVYIAVCLNNLIKVCRDNGIVVNLAKLKGKDRTKAEAGGAFFFEDQVLEVTHEGQTFVIGGGTLHRIIYSFNRPLPLMKAFAEDHVVAPPSA